MADPLSITAGIIAVATAAAKTASTISKLREIHQLPGRLHAIHNEVSDLEVTLRHTASVLADRRLRQVDKQTVALSDLLKQADRKLVRLDNILKQLITTCVGNGKFFVRAKAWLFEKPRIQVLQDDLRTIKSNLNILLGAAHTRDMTRVQLDLHSIALVTNRSVEKHTQSQIHIDEKFAGMEKLLLEQFASLRNNFNAEMGPGFLENSSRLNNSPAPNSTGMALWDKEKKSSSIAGISVQATHYGNLVCNSPCRCNCHAVSEVRSPSMVGPLVGQLFVGYIGQPRLRQRCDTVRCRRNQASTIKIEYFFPLWFLARVVMLMLSYQSGTGPQMQLRTLRLVPDSAQSITYVLSGNIEGLKHLFAQGLASPNDVSQTRNYSLLRWAVYGKQINTCRFLIDVGADSDNEREHSSRDRLWDFLLRGKLDKLEEATVKGLLENSDYVEDQHFPHIHKIVLQMSLRSLEEELFSNPFAISETDIDGRTALFWAAARGDERSTHLLLSHGADPNAMDKNGITPIYLAANEGRTMCARLLLESQANPDPVSPAGVPTRSSPLLCAAMNETPILTMQTLLGFGANIEAQSPDGETPLCAVARTNTAAHALLLIEKNANMNARTRHGKTPLTLAIVHNNHGVLELLLDRWDKYDTCPRLFGPNLLGLVADFADVKTIRILADCEHLQLRGDKHYALAVEASERVRDRAYRSDEVVEAFDELILLISQDEERLEEAMLESGILRRNTASSSSTDELFFEDAAEDIEIGECDF